MSSQTVDLVTLSTALGFIGDEKYANPIERLDSLVAFLKRVEGNTCGRTSPLAKLDLLYSYILGDVPEDIFPATWRILAYFIYARDIEIHGFQFLYESAHALCNFLDMTEHTFYAALRQLHSVIEVPPPENAVRAPLRFYHASFPDFLVDANRSKGFFIEKKEALVAITKSLFFWHEIDSRHFHVTFGELAIPIFNWAALTPARTVGDEITYSRMLVWIEVDLTGRKQCAKGVVPNCYMRNLLLEELSRNIQIWN